MVVQPVIEGELGYRLVMIDGRQAYNHARIDQEIFAKLHRSQASFSEHYQRETELLPRTRLCSGPWSSDHGDGARGLQPAVRYHDLLGTALEDYGRRGGQAAGVP